MPETVLGLPLHPLIVHGTVIVVPVAAIAVLLFAFWPRFRSWSGPLTPVLAVLALVLVPLSTSTGETLEARLEQAALHGTVADPPPGVWLVQLDGSTRLATPDAPQGLPTPAQIAATVRGLINSRSPSPPVPRLSRLSVESPWR